LGGKHTVERLEAAAARALHFGAYSFTSVESILRHHLEREPLPGAAVEVLSPVVAHPNIRGAAYFEALGGESC
jgi:hypothetical protein